MVGCLGSGQHVVSIRKLSKQETLTWQAAVLLAQILDNCSGLVELPSNEQGILPMHRVEALHIDHTC